MILLILLIILAVLFLGGGGYYYRTNNSRLGGGIGLLGIILIVVVVYLLLSGRGYAQEPGIPEEGIGHMFEPIIDQIITTLGALLAAATTAFLAWLASWLRARFLVQQDKDRADSLNTAVDNAAGGVINVLGEKVLTEEVKPSSVEVKNAVDYVETMNPGDVAYFNLKSPAIAEKVVNAVGKLTAPSLVNSTAISKAK